MGTRDDVARADTLDSSGGERTADAVALPAPFVFRRELSRGGMGRVLIAWDQLHGREVAVKLIGSGHVELAARFAREAQVTARLQHPAIVPVYHSGTLDDGEPFYVMRLVSGQSLDAVVEGRPLPARLALLPQVIAAADAVAYAHDRHVVHRDLKPQNILVGQFGETVVIDWGLAKDLVAGPETVMPVAGDGPPALTQVGQVMGTPAYMPPEQARGDEVDERADVYALGAVLYHVLAGVPPYDGPSGAAVIAEVLEHPPAPLDRDLPADLRAVVDKAMARDPAARYPSAAQLAEDLKKFQTGQLVGAHQYSLLELVRRFAARQTAAVTVAAVLLVAMIVLTAVGLARITRARDVAEMRQAEAQKAREAAEGLVRYLVVELAERLERQGWIALLKGVGEAVVHYEESNGTGHSPRQARALELMAKAEGPRGDLATAERALRKSVEIRRRLAAEAPEDPAAQRELLGAEWRLMQRVHQRHGVTPELTAFIAREPALVREVELRNDSGWLDEISQALGQIAEIREMMGALPAEMATLRASTYAAERSVALAPKELGHRRVLAWALTDLADALRRAGRADEARDEHARALALTEALAQEHAAEPSYLYDLWRALQRAALLASDRGDFRAAESFGARTLPLILDLARWYPENADYQEALVYTRDTLGSLAFDQGKYAVAKEHFEEEVRVSERLRAQGIYFFEAESQRGHALQCLGWIQVLTGHPEAGVQPMREALAIEERSVAIRPGDTATELDFTEQLSDLAYAELRARRFGDAVGHLQRAAQVVDRNLGRDASNRQWQVRGCFAFGWLGAALGGEGKNDEARVALMRAMAIAGPLLGPGADVDIAAAVAEAAAMTLETLGPDAQARELLRRALPILEQEAKRGELYASAATELKKWRRLAR